MLRSIAGVASAALVAAAIATLSTPAAAGAPLSATAAEQALRSQAGSGLTLRRGADGVVHQMGTAAGRPIGRTPGVRAGGAAAARGFLTAYGAAFGVADPSRDLRATASTALAAGHTATRFGQVAGGLPVLGGELVVVTDRAGNVLSAGGETTRSVHAATPQIAAGGARATAVRATAKSHRGARLTAGPATLIGYDPTLLGAPGRPGASPVWRVEVRGAAVRDLVLVDALTGAPALHISELATAANKLVCDFGNAVNDNYVCGSANKTRGEGDPPSGIADADAAWTNAQSVSDFYQGALGVDLTALIGSDYGDAAGLALRSSTRVCRSTSPCPYDNAFWDGWQMVYGQGYAAAEDVVGHEMTHGVTQHTSDLYYVYQSGAINESMSDIFGELIDQGDGVSTPDTSDAWLLGEDLPAGPGRSLSDPPAFNQPDRMTSPLYDASDVFTSDNGGVHTNSGVGNKAGYLIAHGGTFNGRTVTGLGPAKTAAIYFRTENLLATGADYADLAATLPTACQQLVGTAGIVTGDCSQVQSAVAAVEMTAQPTVAGAAAPEAPRCDTGKTERWVYSDNMETPGGWHPVNSAWDYTSGYATSGRLSLIGTTPDAAPANVYGGSIQSGPLYVSAGPTTYLRFSHYDEFDVFGGTFFDGGQVLYSLNSGSTWLDAGTLPAVNGYNATITPSAQRSFRGFGGLSRGYVSTRINVSSLGGHSVLFRFQILGDGDVSSAWLVDDTALFQCGYPTAITLGRSAPVALYGYGLTLSGTLRYAVGGAPLPPVTVALVSRQVGRVAWSTLASTTSSSSGSYAFAVKPVVNTEYQARFAGSPSFLPVSSATATVLSAPVVAASASPSTLAHGTDSHISVTVRPAHAGQQVTLQRLVGSTWTFVSSGALSSASTIVFTIRPLAAGTFYYRVYKTADADHTTGISATMTVRAT